MRFFLIGITSFALFSCSSAPENVSWENSFYGVITESESGLPMHGARVKITYLKKTATFVTNSNGEYHSQPMPSRGGFLNKDSYPITISVNVPGFKKNVKRNAMTPSGIRVKEINLTMIPKPKEENEAAPEAPAPASPSPNILPADEEIPLPQ